MIPNHIAFPMPHALASDPDFVIHMAGDFATKLGAAAQNIQVDTGTVFRIGETEVNFDYLGWAMIRADLVPLQ